MTSDSSLPPKLQELVDLFASAPKRIKVEAMVDFSDRLPDPPSHIAQDQLEAVPECQTPFFVAAEVDDAGAVVLHFQVPRESPTMRGYAEILRRGLDGSTPDDIVAVPNTFYVGMGLDEVVTQRRLTGMSAILARIKRLVAAA